LRNHNLITAIDLENPDLDVLIPRGWYILADKIGADGQLAVATIHQNGELDRSRPPIVHHGVQRCPNRSSREQHVIHQHDVRISDVSRKLGLMELEHSSFKQIVAVKRDVELPAGDYGLLKCGDCLLNALSEGHAAGTQSYENEAIDAAILLDDLVRHAEDGSPNTFRVEEDFPATLTAGRKRKSLSPLRSAARGPRVRKISTSLLLLTGLSGPD